MLKEIKFHLFRAAAALHSKRGIWRLRANRNGGACSSSLAGVDTRGEGRLLPRLTGNIPLPDLGAATYQGFQGGLYPDGSNALPGGPPGRRPRAGGSNRPANAAGIPDEALGQIGLISVGLSNTTFEFSDGPDSFKPRADAGPSRNPKLTIVDGAQGGRDAVDWADAQSDTWVTLDQRLAAAGVSPAQVQVAWMKLPSILRRTSEFFPLTPSP